MENYKVFVQLGKQKSPKWTNGKVLEKYSDDTCLVETHGQELVLSNQKIKPYKKAKYDSEKGGFIEIIEFTNKNWEELKTIIVDAMDTFFPDEKFSIDENEKTIYAMDNQLSISGGIFEVESLSMFEDVPKWSIIQWKPIPATRWEPEDVSEIYLGNSSNNISAAKIFIDSIWAISCEVYWENKNYESIG